MYPYSIFLKKFRRPFAFPTLCEGFVLAETVGLGTDFRAIFQRFSLFIPNFSYQPFTKGTF